MKSDTSFLLCSKGLTKPYKNEVHLQRRQLAEKRTKEGEGHFIKVMNKIIGSAVFPSSSFLVEPSK